MLKRGYLRRAENGQKGIKKVFTLDLHKRKRKKSKKEKSFEFYRSQNVEAQGIKIGGLEIEIAPKGD